MDKGVHLNFKDNGNGKYSETSKAGIGLKSMESKVHKYGGQVSIKKEEGFQVIITLPLAN